MVGQDARAPDELWTQVQIAGDTITVDETNNLAESFRSRLLGVIVRHGESLIGHNDVRRMLADGYGPGDISELREKEKAIVQGFIEMSREFLGRDGWNPVTCQAVHQESIDIVQQLPRKTRERLKMIWDEETTQSVNAN
jgi:hypothetical protein